MVEEADTALPLGTSPYSLCGSWRLDRRLHDVQENQHGRVHGSLLIQQQSDGLHWYEQAILHWKGLAHPVGRHTLLHPNDDGEWWMFFDDGRPFHPWLPGRTIVHPCGEDDYHGIVQLDGPDQMRTLWDVTGPSTGQRIFTRFRRAG